MFTDNVIDKWEFIIIFFVIVYIIIGFFIWFVHIFPIILRTEEYLQKHLLTKGDVMMVYKNYIFVAFGYIASWIFIWPYDLKTKYKNWRPSSDFK